MKVYPTCHEKLLYVLYFHFYHLAYQNFNFKLLYVFRDKFDTISWQVEYTSWQPKPKYSTYNNSKLKFWNLLYLRWVTGSVWAVHTRECLWHGSTTP